jgi:hypothetical protein
VFIDEITFLQEKEVGLGGEYSIPGFIERGLDIFAILSRFGIHVIVSGTDSYALALAKSSPLLGRIEFLHTTSILYSEYVDLVGKVSITDYLKNGGVLPWGLDLDWEDYVNNAIINNVIVSMQAIHPSDNRSSFRLLFLRDTSEYEIRSLLLHVLSMSDLSFAGEALAAQFQRAYKSPEFDAAVHNLANREPSLKVSKDFREKVKVSLIEELRLIYDVPEQTRMFYCVNMEDLLCKLDVVTPFDLYEIFDDDAGTIGVEKRKIYALSIAGLRNFQLSRTLTSIADVILAETAGDSYEKYNVLLQAMKEYTGGILLEYLIISDTVRYLSSELYDISQIRVTIKGQSQGEIDLVVYDRTADEASLFEIKHSDKIDKNQLKHLVSPDFTRKILVSRPDTMIKSYNVIYRGVTVLDFVYTDDVTDNSVAVRYINAEDYLCEIDRWV